MEDYLDSRLLAERQHAGGRLEPFGRFVFGQFASGIEVVLDPRIILAVLSDLVDEEILAESGSFADDRWLARLVNIPLVLSGNEQETVTWKRVDAGPSSRSNGVSWTGSLPGGHGSGIPFSERPAPPPPVLRTGSAATRPKDCGRARNASLATSRQMRARA